MNKLAPLSAVALGALFVSVSGGVAATTQQPSFDCAKASTAVEKAICSDNNLAVLDREMAAHYTRAAAVTPTPVTLRAGQRTFLAERALGPDGAPAKAIDKAALAEAYQQRNEVLASYVHWVEQANKTWLSPADLSKRCAEVGIAGCKVEASGKVAGSAPFGGLVYQVQVPGSEDEWRRGVVVLREIAGRLKPVFWNYEGDIPGVPSVVTTPQGPLLVIPARHGGTGAFNAELVLRRAGDGWRDLEIDAWRPAFNRQLPKEVGVWKGVEYDWKTLTMASSLWKDSDVNCCPTGGRAKAVLTVDGDRLALQSMSVDRTPPREK